MSKAGKLTPAMIATLAIAKGWENALENLQILIRRSRFEQEPLSAEQALQLMREMKPRRAA